MQSRHLLLSISIVLLLVRVGLCRVSLLDNNLKVVDLSDLRGELPLGISSSQQILQRTENWEIPTWQNPNWPAGGGGGRLWYTSVVKNDAGPNADGKYYLYYAHHDPSSGIGVAVADSITGPYSKAVSVPGRADNQVVPSFQFPAHPDSPDHNSSPSVVWNEQEQRWFMYFHYYNHLWGQTGPDLGTQLTALATTSDLASHRWTVWQNPSLGTAPPWEAVLPTTTQQWINEQSSYHAVQRLPNGQWLAFLRGTSTTAGDPPKLGFATSDDGRNFTYFAENPVIHQGAGGHGGKSGVYRPNFVGYLGKDNTGADEYLVAWSEASYFDSNVQVIYGRTTDFKTFVRDPRGYAHWPVADGIVTAWREADQLYLFTGDRVHVMDLDVTIQRILADVSNDGAVNNLDVTAFIIAIAATDRHIDVFDLLLPDGCFLCADTNDDGRVNNLDITEFINILEHASLSSVPSPTMGAMLAMGLLAAVSSSAFRRSDRSKVK